MHPLSCLLTLSILSLNFLKQNIPFYFLFVKKKKILLGTIFVQSQ